jgi:hypothetical protein
LYQSVVGGQHCMPFEIISGFVGATIAELVSKFLPARKAGQLGDESLKIHERRNKWLYRGLLASSVLGFLTPFALFPPGADGRLGVGPGDWIGAWFAGAVFGLPFSAMLLFVIVTWLALGKQRARELLVYFEIKQKTNIYFFYVFGATLAPIGIMSLLFLYSA